MTQPPPLPAPLALPRKNAWERNWKWIIPVACLAFVGLGAGCLAGFLGMIKSSDAYQGALARIQNSPEIRAALGTPIKDGWLFTGSIKLVNASGTADLAIPVSGPTGAGTAYVNATKTDGVWHFDRLLVQVTGSPRRVDLSDASPANEAPVTPR